MNEVRRPAQPEPAAEDSKCIVCGRPSGGKAVCGSEQCALELRQG